MKLMAATDPLFHHQMEKAMVKVRNILDLTRTPRYAEEEDHVYADKFGLAEFLTNSAIAAQVNVFERIGLDEEKLQKLVNLVQTEKRSVTLRFALEKHCTFMEEKTVKIESPNEVSVEISETKLKGDTKKEKSSIFKRRVVTSVKEYHWQFGFNYKLFAFAGSDPEADPVIFKEGIGSTIIITTGNKRAPAQAHKVHNPVDLPLTWMLQNLVQDGLKCNFHIDRSNEETHTPRRNKDIDDAFEFFRHGTCWSDGVARVFLDEIEPILGKHEPAEADSTSQTLGKSLSSLDASEVFVPVLALMENRNKLPNEEENEVQDVSPSGIVSFSQLSDEASPLLCVGDVNRFLSEQCRSLDGVIDSINLSYPNVTEGKLISSIEATVVICCHHTCDIASHLKLGVDYIEQMLHNQMVSAIGKVVQQKDFEEFSRFHNKRIFSSKYAPKPFCYAIRRPDHFPDGVLSIESNDEPIETVVRKISGEDSPPMYFPINAATSVEFTGERYLHAWVRHRFESSTNHDFKLVARTRQFSSFLLMAGTITGSDSFEPQDAIILQNKDEVLIPLLLNELPTAKEFKDAISSLSPEQQRFAKSFRSMQLESSVFGVCVVQLKPQLEKLLGLPPDALTKEIGLTQDLLSLFIDYQIPSDLLSFDGSPDASVAQKVDAVKGYVKSVQEVIDSAKAKQLEEEVQKADMRAEVAFGGGAPVASAPFGVAGFAAGASFGAASFGSAQSASAPKSTSLRSGARKLSKRSVRSAPSPPEPMYRLASPEDACVDDIMEYTSADMFEAEKETYDLIDDKAEQYSTSGTVSNKTGGEVMMDFTAIPKQLDSTFEQHDKDNALRTTKIKLGDVWTRMRQENLLTKVSKSTLDESTQKTEKNKAFDLLDALSRSGSLPIACAELHVVLGITHCFEKTVMGTVIEDNINPIEKVDRSMFMIASTIHGVSANALMEGAPEEKSLRLGTDGLLKS